MPCAMPCSRSSPCWASRYPGSVIIESIFALPGLGQLFYAAVMARDYTMIMGNLVLGAVLTLLGNLLADVCYGLADPRIRSSREVR